MLAMDSLVSFPIPITFGQDATRSNSDVFYKVDKAADGMYATKVERVD